MTDEPVGGKKKKRGWLWWLCVVVVLGIISDSDDDGPLCSVNDEAFNRSIQKAIGQWKIEDVSLFATHLTNIQTDEAGKVHFLASVAHDSGWKGTAVGSVKLRGCKASLDQVQ